MSESKDGTEPAVDGVVLLPCPFCGVSPSLEHSFDIDCESTTAWIMCEGCDCKYGPLYPDTKQDVIDWMEGWNKRRSDRSSQLVQTIAELTGDLDKSGDEIIGEIRDVIGL